MSNPVWSLIAGAALLYFITRAGVTVESVSDVMKRVTVGPRSYLVTRLGGGVYNVTTTDAKASLSFGQEGIHSEIGDPARRALMRADVQQFPKDLFA